MAQGLVALRTGLALVGDWSVGLVVLDCPFLSDERAGESCHLPPLSTLGGGCLPSLYPLCCFGFCFPQKTRVGRTFERSPHRGKRASKWVNSEVFSLRVPLEMEELKEMLQVHLQSNVKSPH